MACGLWYWNRTACAVPPVTSHMYNYRCPLTCQISAYTEHVQRGAFRMPRPFDKMVTAARSGLRTQVHQSKCPRPNQQVPCGKCSARTHPKDAPETRKYVRLMFTIMHRSLTMCHPISTLCRARRDRGQLLAAVPRCPHPRPRLLQIDLAASHTGHKTPGVASYMPLQWKGWRLRSSIEWTRPGWPRARLINTRTWKSAANTPTTARSFLPKGVEACKPRCQGLLLCAPQSAVC